MPKTLTSPLDRARLAIAAMARAEMKVEAARLDRDRAIHDIAASTGAPPRLIAADLGVSTSCIRWVLKAPRPPESRREAPPATARR